MDRLGPRHENLVNAWAETISTEPEGEHYRFTSPTRSEELQNRVEQFLEDLTEESFEEVWSRDVLRNAVYGGSGLVLNNWERPIDELADLVESMQTAPSYDTAWAREFPEVAERGLWEFFGRLDPEDRPIINNSVGRAVATFGFSNPSSFTDCAEQIDSVRALYEDEVGHVTAGTSHEVPLYEELEQFLYVIETADERELRSALGMDAPTYGSFAGWDAMTSHGDEITLTGLRPILDAFTTASDNEAYDENPLEHWGADHWETWKDDYCEYLETEVFPTYDPTALEANDVEGFLDALSDSEALSNNDVPIYLLGGRWQPMDDFESISLDSPDEAADVLSNLLDETSGPITERLRRFNDFYAGVSDSGSERMSLATMLLMVTHPDQYTMYRYSMFKDFFDAFSDYDIPNGFNQSDYVLMNDALRRVRDDLDEHAENSVRMLDIHSLIWVHHREGAP